MQLAEIEKSKGKKAKGKKDDAQALIALKVNSPQMAKIIVDLTNLKNRLAFQNFEMEKALMANDASFF